MEIIKLSHYKNRADNHTSGSSTSNDGYNLNQQSMTYKCSLQITEISNKLSTYKEGFEKINMPIVLSYHQKKLSYDNDNDDHNYTTQEDTYEMKLYNCSKGKQDDETNDVEVAPFPSKFTYKSKYSNDGVTDIMTEFNFVFLPIDNNHNQSNNHSNTILIGELPFVTSRPMFKFNLDCSTMISLGLFITVIIQLFVKIKKSAQFCTSITTSTPLLEYTAASAKKDENSINDNEDMTSHTPATVDIAAMNTTSSTLSLTSDSRNKIHIIESYDSEELPQFTPHHMKEINTNNNNNNEEEEEDDDDDDMSINSCNIFPLTTNNTNINNNITTNTNMNTITSSPMCTDTLSSTLSESWYCPLQSSTSTLMMMNNELESQECHDTNDTTMTDAAACAATTSNDDDDEMLLAAVAENHMRLQQTIATISTTAISTGSAVSAVTPTLHSSQSGSTL